MIIPNIWENKKCSKPPISSIFYYNSSQLHGSMFQVSHPHLLRRFHGPAPQPPRMGAAERVAVGVRLGQELVVGPLRTQHGRA